MNDIPDAKDNSKQPNPHPPKKSAYGSWYFIYFYLVLKLWGLALYFITIIFVLFSFMDFIEIFNLIAVIFNLCQNIPLCQGAKIFIAGVTNVKFLLITNLTHFFYVFVYFISLHVSSITVLNIRRSNCINTSSGIVSLCMWLIGMPVRRDQHTNQSLTQTNHTRWCVNTIRSPDVEHCDARNM